MGNGLSGQGAGSLAAAGEGARAGARCPRRRRRMLVAAIAAYLLALHALTLVAVFKTDFLVRVERQLGRVVGPKEFDATYKRWAGAYARSDARARPGALVFLGDSIMRDLDTSSIARHTLNLAIPGDTSARVLARAESYRSLKTARGVALGFGVNDLFRRGVPEILENYRRVLALIPADTPVLVVAGLPIDERLHDAFTNADIARLNEGMAALCAERSGCHFLDPSPALRDDTGNLAAEAHEGDGIHLSIRGHDLYWAAINAAVLTHIPPETVTPPAQ